MILVLLALLFVAVKRIRNIRPRIKKRFIMKKNPKQQELSSRPLGQPSSNDQCEITIENCCNMNICETVSIFCFYDYITSHNKVNLFFSAKV